ncbi:MAG: LysR family transcriptional regulator [Oscillospiraceae bacterium]|nr:LysR family transcriptional regulator [Oscillospiraceae bacterium]
MNLQHLRCMVEVARVGSITRAAANLFMGQPNLSKAIKEIEDEVGITIFNRSAKGVYPTEQGAQFLEYAQAILVQMDRIDDLGKSYRKEQTSLRITVPRVEYIYHAVAELVDSFSALRHIDIDLREANAADAVNNIYQGISTIAVIRYEDPLAPYFNAVLSEKRIYSELLLRSKALVTMSDKDPLADKSKVSLADLSQYTEIIDESEHTSPPYSAESFIKAEKSTGTNGKISVCERGIVPQLLCKVKKSFMWSSPIPEEMLKRYNLVQTECGDFSKEYTDVIIMPSNLKPNEIESTAIDCLRKAAENISGDVSN